MVIMRNKWSSSDSSAILAVAKGSFFSDQLTDRALKAARNSQSILVALNVCSDEGFPPGVERERSRRNLRTDCNWNILSMRKAATLLGVRMDHLILFGSALDCIETVHGKYPRLKCVLAEPVVGSGAGKYPTEVGLPLQT